MVGAVRTASLCDEDHGAFTKNKFALTRFVKKKDPYDAGF
jgi:hypothetical protein